MQFELAITFTQDLSAEKEVFATRAEAISFAKLCSRNGLVVENEKEFVYYPQNILSVMYIEETDLPITNRLPGHGL